MAGNVEKRIIELRKLINYMTGNTMSKITEISDAEYDRFTGA